MKHKKKAFPRSLAKFIRSEKSRIRKTIAGETEQANRIAALYERFSLMSRFK